MQRREYIDPWGATLLIGFSALLGFNQALVKIVNVGMAPIFQGGLRSAAAVGVVVIWMLLRRRPLGFRRDCVLLGVLNGSLFALEFALLFIALDLSGVARVSLLFYTMPFYVAIAAHFLFPGEALTPVRVAGLLCAIAGIGLVLSSGAEEQINPWGDLAALMASLAWAGIALLTRATRLSELSPEQNLLYHLIVSAVLLLAAAAWLGDDFREMTSFIWGVFAFQVVAVASLGFMLWFWILSIYPVSNMASFSLLTPLFGVFFGWLIFDEALTPKFIVALTAVCAGLLLINRRPSPSVALDKA